MRNSLAAVTLFFISVAAAAAWAGRLDDLDVMGANDPRAYFFRAAEGAAARPQGAYGKWNATFSRLMGIEGKALEEEVPGRSRNIPFFTRFKADHPRQLVLLHFNGNAHDPRTASPEFFAGHWLYHNGARILKDVPAESGETEIAVDHPELFLTGIGRYGRDSDDVGLCALTAAGKPDWARSEQVQLLSVDAKRKIIRVRRGCFGTQPQSFRAGAGYAAAHVSEGPWGNRSHMLWAYNYATSCPRDASGRQARDVLAHEIAGWFAPGGKLQAFDGLEFDVLHHRQGRGGRRGPDVNADGRSDGGIVDGVNVYGIGVVQFLAQLRRLMGEDRLMLADGHSANGQRGFGILNGIESEGFPSLSDHDLNDWSGGLNRHQFWSENGRRPVFNYINHKFVQPGSRPGQVRRVDVPFSVHRLVFAAAMFTNAAVCYSTAPRPEPGESYGIWDEMRAGRDHQLGWLGKPLEPVNHMACLQPDLLEGQCAPFTPDHRGRWRGDGMQLNCANGRLRVIAGDRQVRTLSFQLTDLPCPGPDLLLAVTSSGDPRSDYPHTMARLVHVSAGWGQALSSDAARTTGMQRRGESTEPLNAASGANVRFSVRQRVGDVSLPGYAVHPPYQPRGTAGMVYWQRTVQLPADATLLLHTGMGPLAPQRSDGVVFRVQAGEIGSDDAGSRDVKFEPVFEHQQLEARWMRHVVSLARWSGKRVALRFEADCGPKDNSTTDHAFWGNVRVGSGTPGPMAGRADQIMTWCNDKPFTSYFYFRNVQTRRVTVEFTVEGREPFYLHSLTAHAAPEVLYRVYEHGLVLANLGPRPATFDLEQIAPGRKFRRLRGSSKQDPVTNNGQPVSGTLTVPGRDALFLKG